MKPCPSKEDWRLWLACHGDVATADPAYEHHLSACSSCCEMVESLGDEDAFFQQSKKALRSTGLSSQDWQRHDVVEADGWNTQTHLGVVSLVKSLLAPTDDDRSLGRLGRFEVLGVIGTGGMGIVLKARNVDMDRVVAIKIPQPQYWHATDALRTLEHEARSAAAVVHPNIISIHHVDRHRDVPYLVMPYIPGQSLQHRIAAEGALSLSESMRIVRQVASALTAAHACGVVHRDVKPANILMGAGTERVVLSDFGLARVQNDATCTATGTFAGTPIYLSPEQANGMRSGPASDVFSLGTVLWTMLIGSPPMAGWHTHAIVRRVSESKMPSLSSESVDLPRWVIRMAERMHANDPTERPDAATVSEWAEACERHLSGDGQVPDELRQRERPRLALPLVIALVAIAAIGIAYSWPSPSHSKPPTSASTADAMNQGERTFSTEPEAAKMSPADLQELERISVEVRELQSERLPSWEATLESLEFWEEK